MGKLYITSVSYNVVGEPLDVTLCEYENKIEWKQPAIQRCWSEVLFNDEYSALVKLREMYPDRLLTVFEDTGKVLSTFGHESGFTSMVIRREQSDI